MRGGGGVLNTFGSTSDSGVGYGPGGTGSATVTGAGSLWIGNRITIGGGGTGELIIDNEGAVQLIDDGNFSGQFIIGSRAIFGGTTYTGDGYVRVSGSGSELSANYLNIGQLGASGVLEVLDGGAVRVTGDFNSYIGGLAGGRGTLLIDGAGSVVAVSALGADLSP